MYDTAKIKERLQAKTQAEQEIQVKESANIEEQTSDTSPNNVQVVAAVDGEIFASTQSLASAGNGVKNGHLKTPSVNSLGEDLKLDSPGAESEGGKSKISAASQESSTIAKRTDLSSEAAHGEDSLEGRNEKADTKRRKSALSSGTPDDKLEVMSSPGAQYASSADISAVDSGNIAETTENKVSGYFVLCNKIVLCSHAQMGGTQR